MSFEGMTKEEARVQVVLLKLDLDRARKEWKTIVEQFCNRQNHYWRRDWQESKERQGLFRVNHFFCCLCGIWKMPENSPSHCSVCNEKIAPDKHGGEEDVAACAYCGHNNMMDPCGVPLRDIPRENLNE